MTKYQPYCWGTDNVEAMLTKRNWILRDEGVEEKLKDAVFKVTQSFPVPLPPALMAKTAPIKPSTSYGQPTGYEYNVTSTDKRGITVLSSFCLSQMDGNCNGMFVNRMNGSPDIDTFLIKNVASLLGDNVIFTSHYAPKIDEFQKHGWVKDIEAESNRGYSERIAYAHLYLKPEEMATKGFSMLRDIQVVKAAQTAIAGNVEASKLRAA